MSGKGRPSRATAFILIGLLAQPYAFAQGGDFCPIIPQTKTRIPVSPSGGKFITLTAAVPDSVKYRLRFARPKDLVLVDAESLRSESARDALQSSRAQIVLKTAQAPDRIAGLLSLRVTDAETIVTIPASGEGVHAMYGLSGDAQARALRHFTDKVAKPFAAVPGVSVVSARTPSTTIAALIEQKARSGRPDKPLLVVAHNQDGVLKFPDGSTLEIAKIQSLGGPNQRPVLVLSCETIEAEAVAGFASTRRFGFDELASALSAATGRVSKAPEAQLGLLIQELNVALNENTAKKDRRVRVAMAAVGGAVIVAVALALQDDDD